MRVWAGFVCYIRTPIFFRVSSSALDEAEVIATALHGRSVGAGSVDPLGNMVRIILQWRNTCTNKSLRLCCDLSLRAGMLRLDNHGADVHGIARAGPPRQSGATRPNRNLLTRRVHNLRRSICETCRNPLWCSLALRCRRPCRGRSRQKH